MLEYTTNYSREVDIDVTKNTVPTTHLILVRALVVNSLMITVSKVKVSALDQFSGSLTACSQWKDMPALRLTRAGLRWVTVGRDSPFILLDTNIGGVLLLCTDGVDASFIAKLQLLEDKLVSGM